MNNLVHPALSSLIIDFFYTDTNAMASLFLEVFEKEVPCAAVTLAATAVFFFFLNVPSCAETCIDQSCPG